ncbi:MAG: L-seryl-tRNA(Sec) selenium transferase [Pirellulales bacterium]|nr:L-seryl-tRNA(Sec) selenium transferase [Pirellulales bacterium]
MPTNVLRNLPSVSELLESPPLKGLVDKVSHNVVVSRVRTVLDDLRHEVQQAAADRTLPTVSELAEKIARRIQQDETSSLRPVINATGILLHTDLGHAPLADEAIDEMAAASSEYASLELDLRSGQRSQRIVAVEGLLRDLTGAEAALVVNNNAGATMLALAALATGREVIVSRGQLIEVDDSYRLPDVMSASGATLREVGATNKTHLDDYRTAIHERTAAIMLVHTSNFVVGSTASPSLAELVRLGHEHRLPVIHDIGLGAMLDFARFGLPGEPVAVDSIRAGADVVLFSGDKLLGGPQCGILVGRRTHLERIARHPLARGLRVDKLTLAALAATLRLYRQSELALARIPLLQLLGTSLENLKQRAARLALQMAASSAIATAEPIEEVTHLGGDSILTQQIGTWCVALTPADGSVDRLAAALRQGNPPVVGRVRQDRLLLDLRSVPPRHDLALVAAVAALGEPLTPAA